MGRIFGTDGARGIANKELTVDLALSIGRAAAVVLTNDDVKDIVEFVVKQYVSQITLDPKKAEEILIKILDVLNKNEH